MSPPPVETAVETRVRYSETDRMGVAYHAHYLQWAELGRTELMRRHGLCYRELEERGVQLAVSEAGLRIVRPARYDDVLRVCAWLTEVGSRKVVFAYRIERAQDGELLARAWTALISLSPEGRSARLPDDALALMRGLVAPAAPSGSAR